MPQDPRNGYNGHHRSHQEQERQGEAPSAGRRRRALEDDGTGGTRVFDLLSKHGKAPGPATGSHHREPEPPPASQQRGPQPPAPGAQPPSARPPRGTPSERRGEGPPEAASQPPTGRSRAPQQRPEPGTAVWTPPGQGQGPKPGRRNAPRPDREDSTGRRARPGPPAPPPAAPPAPPRAAPTPPPGTPPPGTPRPNTAPPNGPANGHPNPPPAPPPPAANAAPPALPAPPAHNPPSPPANAGPPAPPPAPTPPAPPPAGAGAEATRISEALSGKPSEPEPTRRAQRRPEPQAGPADPEATAQHSPVDADAEATSLQPAPEPQTKVVPGKSGKKNAGKKGAAEKGSGEKGSTGQESGDGDSDEVRAIDATLARFSAVHDEIALEEEERRNKFAWLRGKRKEPELGTDMPFDFDEGRDSKGSRLEWKKQQRKQRTIMVAKIVAVAAALTIFVATGISWGAKTWMDAQFREISSLDPDSSSIKDISKQTGDRNFLLVGSDTRAGAKAGDGVGTAEDEPGARADTTMLAHIPADRSRVLIVSFPRDLEVNIPACERWNAQTGEYTGEQLPPQEGVKLNQAYATGGPKCTTKLVQQLSGLSVTNFLGIDFQGFKSMVEAVRGVEVCTTMPIIDEKLGTVLPQPGRQTISGMQALNYVRAREVYGDGTSDYGRMQRQQLFLSALLRKTMSSQVLLSPQKLSDFVKAVSANTFGENVSTDVLLGLGQSMQGLDANKVTFITVPTTGEANESGNEELLEEETAELFRGIIEGAPVSPSTGAGSSTSSNAASTHSSTFPSSGGPALARPAPRVGPVEIPVRVFNTTDVSGMAGETQTKLEDAGFIVAGAEQLSPPSDRTLIKYSAANQEAAKTLAKSIPGAELVEDPAAGGELRLELGSNYDGTVKPGPATIPDNLSTVNAGKDVCG